MAAIKPEVKEIIRSFINLLQKERQILKVFLYGSHAKGIAGRWSDIDIAVVSPDFSEDLFEERIKLMKLSLGIDARIEPCPLRPEDFDENNPLVDEISKTGVEVFGDREEQRF